MSASTSASSPSSPISPRSPPCTFADLPFELRRQIWHDACYPRMLSVVPHFGSTSLDRSHPASCLPFVKQHPFHLCCLTFTVAEGLHPELEPVPYWAEEPFYSCLRTNFQKEYASARPRPRTPVVLQVCRESRDAALQRYELAFPGTTLIKSNFEFTKMFAEGDLHEPKVWVDWERDTIFAVHADNSLYEFQSIRGESFYLDVMAQHAEYETKKIQRLAVAGHWNTSVPDHVHSKLRPALLKTTKNFESLREILIYHGDLDRDAAQYSARSWDDTGIGLNPWPRRRNVVFRSDQTVEEVKKEVGEEFLKAKEGDDEWVQKLPEVKVSRELQWGWTNGILGWNLHGTSIV